MKTTKKRLSFCAGGCGNFIPFAKAKVCHRCETAAATSRASYMANLRLKKATLVAGAVTSALTC